MPSDEPDASGVRVGRASPRGRMLRLLPYVYLFLIGMLAATVHIVRYTEFSPIDELRHVDYAFRVSRFDVPRYGDLLVQESMREEACRGVDLGGYVSPPCDSEVFDPVAFRDDGYQIASIHPPPYYVGAGFFARVAKGLGLSDSFVDPARVFSALLLGAGLVVAFAAGRLLGLRTAPLLAALTFVPVMPTVLHSASTVNPDATALLVGAVVMLVALLWERGLVPTVALPIVGLIAAGVKFTSVLAAIVVAAIFVVRAEPLTLWQRWRRGEAIFGDDDALDDGSEPTRGGPGVRTRREYLLGAIWIMGAAVLVAAAWSGIDRARALVEPIEIPQVRQVEAVGIPPADFFFHPLQVFAWLPPTNGYDTARFGSVFTEDVRTLTSLLFAGAALVAALRVNRRDDISMYGACAVALALLGGPGYVALNVAVQDTLLTLPARYGMSLLPFLAAVVASFARNRIGTAFLWIGAAASFGVVVGTMLAR